MKRGEQLRAGLSAMSSGTCVTAVRGRGLLNAIVIDDEGDHSEEGKAWDLCMKMAENGLLAKVSTVTASNALSADTLGPRRSSRFSYLLQHHFARFSPLMGTSYGSLRHSSLRRARSTRVWASSRSP